MTKACWFIAAVFVARALTGDTWAIADNNPPSAQQVAFAEVTYDLMLKELVAALFKEFDDTTAANVKQGKLAISLIFHNKNRDMRLVGTRTPLLGGANNFPRDDFEEMALGKASQGLGHRSVERVAGQWYLRRSLALNNNFHSACVQCPPISRPTKGTNGWAR